MILASVQFYDVVLWLHLTALVVAFGPTYAYGVFFAVGAKSGPVALAAVGRAVSAWDRMAVTSGGLVILLSGIYLTADRWDFADFFVSWGILAVILVLGLTHAFFLPRTARVIELLEAGNEKEAQAEGETIGKVGAMLGVIVILTIYVMTTRPFG